MTSNSQSLPSGEDMAAKALEDGSDEKALPEPSADDAEVEESNKLAETLQSLQNLIEKHARELGQLNEEKKQKREQLKNIFDNDASLGEAMAQIEIASESAKTRKSQLQANPQVTSLKVQIGELSQQQKEIEETLSNHLVNYHDLTHSTSFDTSDGDQWDFSIRAKIKAKKLG